MPGRIVLFGATGYTGRLTAAALVEAGALPLLAGRSRDSLDRLAAELGGNLDTATADVADPVSVRALLEPGDVMVSTVGPFKRWGAPAVEAAIDAGCPYIDSTGEPPFIRRVFEEWGPRAARAGTPLLTALGYDWVPGNLAGALALAEAGDAARRIEIGYFITGSGMGGMSGGTMASTAGAMLEPGFAFRNGRVMTEGAARRLRTFDVGGKRLQGVSIGSSEHFTLPPLSPSLVEVDCYLGWFGAMSRAMQISSLGLGAITRIGPLKHGLETLAERFVKGSTGGPSESERASGGSSIVAIASGAGGETLAEVRVEGLDGYSFTANFLAWSAIRALAGEIESTGAIGPASAFGLEAFERGVAESGINRV